MHSVSWAECRGKKKGKKIFQDNVLVTLDQDTSQLLGRLKMFQKNVFILFSKMVQHHNIQQLLRQGYLLNLSFFYLNFFFFFKRGVSKV